MTAHDGRDEIVERLYRDMRLPVIAAPMFLVSGPALVAEACRAGVIGAFPGPNARTIEELRSWFEEIAERLEKARANGERPACWAFNMVTHTTYGRFEEEIELVGAFKPPLVISALGGPHRIADPVHAYGGAVFADVNSPRYARSAIDKGADGLVLVASGAGGHTGEYSLLAFIEEVRGFWDGPLAVGGAISTGAAIRAVELLGADFAYMGTRFIASPESLVEQAYREMVVGAAMSDLVASRALTGALGNWMRPSLERAGLTLEDMKVEAKVDFSPNFHEVKAWKTVWSAGHGVGATRAVLPVAEIVRELTDQYCAAVAAERGRTRFLDRNVPRGGDRGETSCPAA